MPKHHNSKIKIDPTIYVTDKFLNHRIFYYYNINTSCTHASIDEITVHYEIALRSDRKTGNLFSVDSYMVQRRTIQTVKNNSNLWG